MHVKSYTGQFLDFSFAVNSFNSCFFYCTIMCQIVNILFQSSPSPPSCQAPLGQDPLCPGILLGYKCAFSPPPLQSVQFKCSSLYSERKSITGSIRSQRTLPLLQAPLIEMHWMKEGFPKSALIVVIFANF